MLLIHLSSTFYLCKKRYTIFSKCFYENNLNKNTLFENYTNLILIFSHNFYHEIFFLKIYFLAVARCTRQRFFYPFLQVFYKFKCLYFYLFTIFNRMSLRKLCSLPHIFFLFLLLTWIAFLLMHPF